jgi:hypothetical protein
LEFPSSIVNVTSLLINITNNMGLAGERKRKARDREKMKKEMRERAKKDWTKRKALHKRDKKWQTKKARADARRMQHGRPLGGEDENENADSMDAANGSERGNGGQPVVLKSFPGETIETPYKGPPPVPESAAPDEEQDSVANAVSSTAAEHTTALEEGKEGHTNISAQDAEQESVAAAVSRDAYPTPPAPSASAADKVVQPLSEVVAAADGEGERERPPTPIIQINGVDAVTDVKPLPNPPPLAAAEADIAPDSRAPAPPLANREFDARLQPGVDVDDASETDSFPDFDYQTDLDMDSDVDVDDGRAARRRSRVARDPSPKGSPDGDDGDDEPWNAVCVVGLRVYSLISGADLSLEVVRPRIDDSDEDDDDDDKPEAVLDRDDPAKGAEVENIGSNVEHERDVID